uniref:DUF2242 domain-containing protein n=1 Tax=Stenotrophomonas sp. TaxID=69392 RepID=UPI0028A6AEFC
VGVVAVRAVSRPFGGNADSLVEVASSTITDADFYRRVFQRLPQYQPAAAAKPAPPAAGAPQPAPLPTPPLPTEPAPPESTPADVPAPAAAQG